MLSVVISASGTFSWMSMAEITNIYDRMEDHAEAIHTKVPIALGACSHEEDLRRNSLCDPQGLC